MTPTDFLLMCVAITFAAINSLILRKFKNRSFNTPGDCFFFNGGVSIVWCVVMLIWFFAAGETHISGGAILFGMIYGIILCLFLYFKTESLSSGPVSHTTLISSAAFVIATWFGVIYANETVNIFQIIGMLLILLSLFLCVNPKKSTEPLTKKWFIFCGAFFLAGGIIGIFYKIFGKSAVSGEVNGMMLSASVFSAIFFFLFGLILNKATKNPAPKIYKDSLIFLVTSAIAGCIYIRLNVSLSKVIPSAIFFPVSNGALVLISTIAGGLMFGEKLNKIQTAGIIVGLVAIIITGCGQDLWNLIFS